MNKLFVVFTATIILFIGCTMQPVKDTARFEIFGENIGVYMKAEHPAAVAETLQDVKNFAKLSDVDLLAADVLGTAYKYAIENFPDDRNLALLAKSGSDLLGLKIDISSLVPEDASSYTENIRAVINGYLKGVI